MQRAVLCCLCHICAAHCKTPSLCKHWDSPLQTPSLCKHRDDPLRSSPHVPCAAQSMQHFLSTFGFFFLKAAPMWQSHENPLHVYANFYLLILILALSIREKPNVFT